MTTEQQEGGPTGGPTVLRLMLGDAAPQLWAVVDEGAVRRRIGSPEVMGAQLERLIKAAELPNVTLQVLPFAVGAHAAEAGTFTFLRFPEPDLPDVVYVHRYPHC